METWLIVALSAFIKNVIGLVTRPYETCRRIVDRGRMGELVYVAILLSVYFAFASVVKVAAFRPFFTFPSVYCSCRRHRNDVYFCRCPFLGSRKADQSRRKTERSCGLVGLFTPGDAYVVFGNIHSLRCSSSPPEQPVWQGFYSVFFF